jgi:formylglycine-generating enzyme required for sulfatase activity
VTDPPFEWPDLLLGIDSATRVSGRVHLRFHGVVGGRQRREFGESEISDPAVQLGQLGETLDSWAAGSSDERRSIETHLEGIGIKLFDDLIPPALQDHYWSQLHGRVGSTVLVVVEEEAAGLPWELVKPATGDVVAPFWCEELSMSRWPGSRPIATELPGHRAACVLADPDLRDVSEVARDRLRVAEADVITDWDGVQALLSCGALGVFHWTGHGRLNPQYPSLSELPIGTESFRPVDVLPPAQRRFLGSGPWVFLNACSTSRSSVGMIGLAGWPRDLVRYGAGAMLGAAWDVRTGTALRFVDALYERLPKGVPVAHAVREARTAARIAGDPSWLAYQLYAHPTARLRPDRTRGDFTSVPVNTLVEQSFGLQGDEATEWRRPYLEALERGPSRPYADIVPLGGSVEPAQDLEYSMVYIEPVVPQAAVPREVRDIAEAVGEHAGVVLLGDSGAGKTTTLRRIARDLAGRALRGDPGVPTPIVISLDGFGTDDDPFGYVRHRCHDQGVRSRLRQELQAGRVCLLCDGLNEVGRHGYRRKVRAWRQFVKDWPGNRFVFACRSAAYQGELKLPEIQIAPLDDERILRTLFVSVGASADEMWDALELGGLLDVARMPLFLEWLIVSFQGSGARLPANRSLLLEGIVKSIISREEDRGSFEDARFGLVTVALAELAHAVLLESSNGAVATDRARAIFEDAHRGAELPVVAEGWRFALDAGVLAEHDGEVRFRSVQLRDYFAACALLRRHVRGIAIGRYLSPSTPEYERTAAPALETEWAEAAILASGLAEAADSLLAEVLATSPRLAGECLARNSPKVTPETVEGIRATLLDRATDEQVGLAERVATGLTLGRIGDPRFRPEGGFIPPILCAAPAGYVWLGSNDDDDQAFADERPQQRVEVAAFRMGRYPVTNAEYQAFVEAGGYDDPGFWTKRGWAWRKARDTGEGSLNRRLRNLAYFRDHPDDLERWFGDAALEANDRELWRRLVTMDDAAARAHLRNLGLERIRSRDAPAFTRYPMLNCDNQPVVGVCWYEAVAYCRWLSAVSGRAYGLPTEAQWERAAKGDDKRVYPWGPSWEPGRCNALPENIQQTTSVGVFPGGRSPFGCEDMAGNVAEWTSSLYAPYPWPDEGGPLDVEAEGVRVTRGGGWDSTPRVVRSALRGDMSEPHTDGASLGFRVMSDDQADRIA